MEFSAHPKTMRWFRDIVVSEKIDGSNVAVIIENVTNTISAIEGPHWHDAFREVMFDGSLYHIGAQSRKKLIMPGKNTDNFGFAGWVADNADSLVRTLGEGRHMGEWWGSGIQRGYGLQRGEKRFSLFNTAKWGVANVKGQTGSVLADINGIPGLRTVPVLYEGVNDENAIHRAAEQLHMGGSRAEPGFKPPEGIAIFHEASNKIFKYTPHHNADGHKG